MSSRTTCKVIIHSESGKETVLEVTGDCESTCRRKAATEYLKKIKEEVDNANQIVNLD